MCTVDTLASGMDKLRVSSSSRVASELQLRRGAAAVKKVRGLHDFCGGDEYVQTTA